MRPGLTAEMAHVIVEDRIEAAERFHRRKEAKEARAATEHDAFESVTVRIAQEADQRALRRLAERDMRPVPGGPVLVAEVDGTLVAARSIHDGTAVADPFRHTAHLTELLALRATHLKNAELDVSHEHLRSAQGWLKGHTLHS
jgi:hypothetical protein